MNPNRTNEHRNHMNNPQEKVWLCWSPRQNCFHIETEADGLRVNLDAFRRGTRVDYVPIAAFANQDEASVAADGLQGTLEKRQKPPGA